MAGSSGSRMYNVTYVNKKLLYFTVDDKIYVNAGIYIASNHLNRIKMPKIGDTFQISEDSIHKHYEDIGELMVYSLCCKGSKYDFTENTPEGMYFSWLIEDYKLGSEDLYTITKIHESIKNKLPSQIDTADVIICCIEKNLILRRGCTNEFRIPKCCSNQSIPPLEIKTISDCKYVQDKGKDYKEFPYWSYGCHWAPKRRFLIGYLEVNELIGVVCLKDAKSTIGCIITKKNTEDLAKLLNKTVYISNYIIFTEIFNPNTRFNMDYLYVDYKNINVIDLDNHVIDNPKIKTRYTLKFIILSKSYVTYATSKGLHFWLHIQETETSYFKTKNQCFLCLSNIFIKRWPTMEISDVYSLHFNEILPTVYDFEYSRMNKNLSQYLIKNNVVLSEKLTQVTSVPLVELNKENVQEILQSKNLISFRTILKSRDFCKPIDSRTQSETKFNFSLLGSKTHILKFENLSLYLNNWERMAMPIGLIPSVVLNVRNVYVQKKEYFKSSPFTTFEIVEYCPEIKFSTPYLLDDSNWGPPQPFNVAEMVPKGVLLHIVVNKFTVISVTIRTQCIKCKLILNSEYCTNCGSTLEIFSTILFELEEGNTKIRILFKNINSLAPFLATDENGWKQWKQVFDNKGMYLFQRKFPELRPSFRMMKFWGCTTHRFLMLEKNTTHSISLLIRKLDNATHSKENETFWFGVKSRWM